MLELLNACNPFTYKSYEPDHHRIKQFVNLGLACVASVSARVRRESWDESKKRKIIDCS